MASFVVSKKLVVAAMQSPKVREGIAARRDQAHAKARRIAAAEGIDGVLSVEDGTRPKGRPYARLLFDNADQEFGTSKTARRRLLGRSR